MKKILAIAVALVMAMALTVAVAADSTQTLVVTNGGWTSENIEAFDNGEVNDDDVITITVEITECTSGWWQAGINIGSQTELFNNESTELTVTMTVAEFLAEVGESSYYQLYFNCSDAEGTVVNVTITATIVAPAEDEGTDGEGEGEAEGDDTTGEPEDGEGENGSVGDDGEGDGEGDGNNAGDENPETGVVLAVVPAIVAMAAVAVSKKH